MPDDRCRLGNEDVIIGLDLASAEHQAVVLTADGQRLTGSRFRIRGRGSRNCSGGPCRQPLSGAEGARVFAFEATGHVWEALAYRPPGAGRAVRGRQSAGDVPGARGPAAEPREDGSNRCRANRRALSDRDGHPDPAGGRPLLALRRAWGEYRRLRDERARLKVLVAHQLYGLFPEFLRVWADLLQPGALAVLRTGLTPADDGRHVARGVRRPRAAAPRRPPRLALQAGAGPPLRGADDRLPRRRSTSSRAKSSGPWRGWMCSPAR